MNRIKKPECQRIDAFELWCWRRLLRVPWTARRSNLSILKDINPEYSLEGQMLKLRLQNCGHLMRRADSLLKDPDAGKDWGQEEKWVAEDEMVRWHHWLNGHELEQTLEDSERQGSPESTIHGVTTSGTRLSKWTQNRMGKPLRFFFLHLDMTVIMNQRWLTTRGRDPCIHCALGPVWKTSLRAEKRKNAWVGSSDWTSLPKTLPLIITPPPRDFSPTSAVKSTLASGGVVCHVNVIPIMDTERERKWSLSVGLFATPWPVAFQAPPSMGFSRQEYWSGLPVPPPKWSEVTQSCPTLCDPMNCSLPGSSIHEILQARSFSKPSP